MGRISGRRIEPDIEERIFEVFWAYLVSLKHPHEMQEFLKSLLSRMEQVMLAKRLAIAVLLERGFNYEYIDETLKVSKSTISSVQKQLQSGATGYQLATKSILANRTNESLWNTLEEIMMNVSLPKRHGSEAWKKKSEAGKRIAKQKRKLSSI